jgi:hypothetical protein
MNVATGTVSAGDLRPLDELVEDALARGDESALPTLGYGEISLVLAWPPERPEFACKRLPVFPSRPRLEAYRRTLDDYLDALAESGISVVATELRAVDRDDGTAAAYVVQPILPSDTLATTVLRRADPARGHPLVAAVAETAAATVGPRLGLDAQLANWVWDDDGLTYIDVSTPLIWSADGECRLDVDLMAQAFPWALRPALVRFVAPRIEDTYRDLREVYFDLCGNLLKEGLDAWLPAFLGEVNRHLAEPMTGGEVQRYYHSDRRLWTTLLMIRRIDRAWRRRVRRTPYPFLLPGKVKR